MIQILQALSLTRQDPQRQFDKAVKYIYTTLIMTAFSLTAENSKDQTPPPRVAVPYVRLLIDPDKYDGHIVRVTGIVSAKYESFALYPNQESYFYHINENGFWLVMSNRESTQIKLTPFDGRWVTLVGRVDAKQKGAFGLFAGLIEVQSITPKPANK